MLEYAEKLGDAAEILAQIDVFRGWAELSREWDYCKPVISNSDTVAIEDGRHPVVEQMLRRDRIGAYGILCSKRHIYIFVFRANSANNGTKYGG